MPPKDYEPSRMTHRQLEEAVTFLQGQLAEMAKLFEAGKAARLAINPSDDGTLRFADPGAQETYDAIWAMRRTIANLQAELRKVDAALRLENP